MAYESGERACSVVCFPSNHARRSCLVVQCRSVLTPDSLVPSVAVTMLAAGTGSPYWRYEPLAATSRTN
jgi:hypothetical protein